MTPTCDVSTFILFIRQRCSLFQNWSAKSALPILPISLSLSGRTSTLAVVVSEQCTSQDSLRNHTPHFPYPTFSIFFIFHIPHFPYSALRTPYSAALLIFHPTCLYQDKFNIWKLWSLFGLKNFKQISDNTIALGHVHRWQKIKLVSLWFGPFWRASTGSPRGSLRFAARFAAFHAGYGNPIIQVFVLYSFRSTGKAS